MKEFFFLLVSEIPSLTPKIRSKIDQKEGQRKLFWAFFYFGVAFVVFKLMRIFDLIF